MSKAPSSGGKMVASRRRAVRGLALGLLALVAGCKMIPAGAPPEHAPPPPATLPTDISRHRVALLVPVSGAGAAAGQSIANAATMALLDTGATNLRITTYDTAAGAPAAAERAIADGNRMILGPLLGEDAVAVARAARRARVPVITFSNDVGVAGDNVFVMGNVPGQSFARAIAFAHARGATRFAALIPLGTYGERASAAVLASARASGANVVGMESYDRSAGALPAAVRRLKARGPFDAVVIADSASVAARAAPLLRAGMKVPPRIIGSELWSGDPLVSKTPALSGALFAATSDQRFHRFADSYRTRFGGAPYRIATLGYDAVLLTLRVAREWQPGTPLPTARLYDRGGFLGLDGPFRFNSDQVVERALEVREARAGSVLVVSPAPARFAE